MNIILSNKKKCTVGALVLSSLVLFGFNGTWDRFRAVVDQITGKVNSVTPTDTLLGVAKRQLASAGEKLQEAEAAAKGYQEQEARIRQSITRLETASAEARCRLEALRPALAAGATGFTHCGAQYSTSEVRADALKLTAFVKDCDAKAQEKQAELKDLTEALSCVDQTLVAAQEAFQEAKKHFTSLEIRIRRQEAVSEATSAARAARAEVSAGGEGDLAGTFKVLEDRLRANQRSNESLRPAPSGPPAGNVRFEAAAGANALKDVDVVLGRTPGAP